MIIIWRISIEFFVFFSYDHVDKLVHNATIDGDAWQPLINYRRILNDEPGGGHGSKARLSTATRGRKRAAPQDGKLPLSIDIFLIVSSR